MRPTRVTVGFSAAASGQTGLALGREVIQTFFWLAFHHQLEMDAGLRSFLWVHGASLFGELFVKNEAGFKVYFKHPRAHLTTLPPLLEFPSSFILPCAALSCCIRPFASVYTMQANFEQSNSKPAKHIHALAKNNTTTVTMMISNTLSHEVSVCWNSPNIISQLL